MLCADSAIASLIILLWPVKQPKSTKSMGVDATVIYRADVA